MKQKHCNRCNKTKETSEFHKSNSNTSGFHYRCKVCALELARLKYLKKNPSARKNSKEPFDRLKARAKPHRRSVKLLYDAKTRARRDGAIVSVTKEWIEEKLNFGVCELTGLPFNFEQSEKWRTNPYSPSLDKIDSTIRDYTPENTRVIIFAANMALGVYGEDIMFDILNKMIINMKQRKGAIS
jgi:hypothetical protein